MMFYWAKGLVNGFLQQAVQRSGSERAQDSPEIWLQTAPCGQHSADTGLQDPTSLDNPSQLRVQKVCRLSEPAVACPF